MSQDLPHYGNQTSSSNAPGKHPSKPNRSSGVFTVLRWLTRGGSASELFFREGSNANSSDKRRSRYLSRSTSSSSSASWCSGNEIDESFIGINGSNSDRSSVDTEASFAYYAPARQAIKERSFDVKEEEERARSLPNTAKRSSEEKQLDKPEARRTTSGEDLGKKIIGRVHVRGKRKAPEPPGVQNTQNQPKNLANNRHSTGSSGSTMRRKKRMAPRPPSTALELLIRAQQQMANNQQPDLVLSNDTLRLERGFLMHVNAQNQAEIKNVPAEIKEQIPRNERNVPIELHKSQSQGQMVPRPWYKRSVMQAAMNVGRSEKGKNENQQSNRSEKRRSCNMTYLANISELDRQTAEILDRDTLRAKFLKKSIISSQNSSNTPSGAPAFMVPKEKDDNGTWKNSHRRHRSARELIAKFNAITRSRNSDSSIQNRVRNDSFGENLPNSAPNSPNPVTNVISIMERSAPSSPLVERITKFGLENQQPSGNFKNAEKSRSPWSCPRCRLQNEYWRIICRVCSAIKPYFDDFTKDNYLNQNPNFQNDGDLPLSPMVTQNEFSFFGKHIFENLSQNKINNKNNGYEEIVPQEKAPQKTDFGTDISRNFEKSNTKLGNQPKPECSKSEKSTPNQFDFSNARFQYFNSSVPSSPEVQKNVPKSPKSPFMKTKNPTNKIEEKIILGDEIDVKKTVEKNDDNKMKQIMKKISLEDVVNNPKIGDESLEANQNAMNDVATQEKENSKKLEREKLKKMLIEMKNSLSKRSANKIRENNGNRVSIVPEEYTVQEPDDDETPEKKNPVVYVVTTENTYENIKIKKVNSELGRPIKVSSSSQTSAGGPSAKEMKESEAEAIIKAIIDKNSQKPVEKSAKNLNEITQNSSTSSIETNGVPTKEEKFKIGENLSSKTEGDDLKSTGGPSNVERVFSMLPGEHDYANAAAEVVAIGLGDTQSADFLMRRLESAITGGHVEEAAQLAQKLAALRLPCTVVTKHQQDNKEPSSTVKSTDQSTKISVLIHVESRTGDAGPPIRIHLSPKWTLAELRTTIANDYGVPSDAQRWILGDKLATDDTATMESFGVTQNDTPIFLYLIQGQQLIKNKKDELKSSSPGPSGLKITSKSMSPTVKIDVKETQLPTLLTAKAQPVKTEALTPISVTQKPYINTASEIVQMVPNNPIIQTTTQLISPGIISGSPGSSTSGQNSFKSTVQTKPLVPIGIWPNQEPKVMSNLPNVINHPITLANEGPKSPKIPNFDSKVASKVVENQKPKVVVGFGDPAAQKQDPIKASIFGKDEASGLGSKMESKPVGSTLDLEANKVGPNMKFERGPKVIHHPIALENAGPPYQLETWYCGICTLINKKESLLCEACGNFRPQGIIPRVRNPMKNNTTNPQKGDSTKATYEQLVKLDGDLDLVPTSKSFECLVCLMKCSAKDGCVLRECLHQFCKNCLAEHVRQCDSAQVSCPYRDMDYTCRENLLDREVRALVPPEDYERHLRRSLVAAEAVLGKDARTYHCRTADCAGFCTYDDDVNTWLCGACGRLNCLTCRAQHAGENCQTYQARVRLEAESGSANDEESRRTRDWLENALSTGEAIECPTCRTVLMKKWGCDWLRCSVCRTEICWVTRGPRWGPAGKGDTSAGCRCGVNGKKCHPNCNYCH